MLCRAVREAPGGRPLTATHQRQWVTSRCPYWDTSSLTPYCVLSDHVSLLAEPPLSLGSKSVSALSHTLLNRSSPRRTDTRPRPGAALLRSPWGDPPPRGPGLNPNAVLVPVSGGSAVTSRRPVKVLVSPPFAGTAPSGTSCVLLALCVASRPSSLAVTWGPAASPARGHELPWPCLPLGERLGAPGCTQGESEHNVEFNCPPSPLGTRAEGQTAFLRLFKRDSDGHAAQLRLAGGILRRCFCSALGSREPCLRQGPQRPLHPNLGPPGLTARQRPCGSGPSWEA